MEVDKYNEIRDLIDKLSTSGKDELEKDNLKQLLLILRGSAVYFNFCHEELIAKLKINHAEVKFGTFLIIKEIFNRSPFYRKIFLENNFLQSIRLLVKEQNPKKPLRPLIVAKKLRDNVSLTLFNWLEEFGPTNKDLATAINSAADVLQIDIRTPFLHAQEISEAARRQEKILKSKLRALRTNIDEHANDLSIALTEMTNCINLLVPRPEDNFLTSNEGDEKQESSDESDSKETNSFNPREHGFTNYKSSIKINISKSPLIILTTDDNESLVQSLKDSYTLLKNRYLPLVQRWLSTVSIEDDIELHSRVKEMKRVLMKELNNYESIKILNKKHQTPTYSNSKPSSSQDNKFSEDNDEIDSRSDTSESDSDFEEVFLPGQNSFCEDLPILIDQNKLKNKLIENSDESESSLFDPNSCNAPLPNGKLCTRKDLIKCPFHGKRIPRDQFGNPTNPHDIAEIEAKKILEESKKVPDWQDPKHLKAIKEKIGIDLTIRKTKRGFKKFSEKYPGLTDLRTKTPRERLAEKLHKKKKRN